MEAKCARYGFDTVLGCCKDSNLFLAHIVRVVCLRNWFGQSGCPIHGIGVGTRGSRLLARVRKEMVVTERDIAYEAGLTTEDCNQWFDSQNYQGEVQQVQWCGDWNEAL